MSAFEMNIPIRCGGSTTLKHREKEVCIEPDECYWITHEAQMRGKKNWVARRNPPPDLAVEMEVVGAVVDRLEIYAALKAPEVWRFNGELLKVLVLSSNGKYRERSRSLAFPLLPMDGFVRFVKKLGSADEVSLLQEFTQWLQSDVVIAKSASSERKNGRR